MNLEVLEPYLGPCLWAGAGVLVGALWPRRQRRPLGQLWAALGRVPPLVPATKGDPWQGALEAVAEEREGAMRSELLHLRTIATREQLALRETVLENLHDGIVVLDKAERILFANQVARRVMELGEIENPNLGQAEARFEIVEGIRSVLAADLARTVKTCRVEWQAEERRHVYLIRAVATTSLDGSQGAEVVVLEDWTAEERASRAKSEFIYGVSHELKTPLTAIQASLELANEPDGLTPDERAQLIRNSYDESMRLSKMVAELLDLARIEAGITEFKREAVDLRELFESLHAMHAPLAERKSISLKWQISDYLADVVGDARLLRQAIVNILGNALKYTKAGGEVTLTARLEGQDLVTSVRDTGVGIAPEDQPRVFEKFFRTKNAEQSTVQGTGLGLPMARYIIERHRGRIELASEVGVGTEFRIYLPASSTGQDEEGSSTLVAMDAATE